MNFSIGLSLASAIFRGSQLLWAQPLQISVTSGTGYAGSVYTSTMPAQWYADGVPIPGADGRTWVMTLAYEGADIHCRAISFEPPEIWVETGGGYAGSVYRTNGTAGQWYADGAAIPGATGSTWTMTIAYEGAKIYYDGVVEMKSNVIKMWVPGAIAPSTHLSRRREETVTVSGGAVVSWANLGASGGAVAQDTASMQPLDNVAQINGQPTIRFTRGSALRCGFSVPYPLTAGGKTVIVIGKDTGDTNTVRCILGGGSISGTNNAALPLAQSGSTNTEFLRNFSDCVWRNNGQIVPIANRGQAFDAVMNAGKPTCYEIFTSGQPAYADSALIGYSPAGTGFPCALDIAEYIIVDRALTDDERASLSAYANAVYGVAA